MNGITLTQLIWSLALGIFLASVCTYYVKAVLGKIVRALIEARAHDEQSAKSLKELDCDNFFARFSLREGSSFSRTVAAVGASSKETSEGAEALPESAETEKADGAKEKGRRSKAKNNSDIRYYLPEEKLDKARSKYRDNGSTLFTVIITLVVVFFVTVICSYALPWLLKIVEGYLS